MTTSLRTRKKALSNYDGRCAYCGATLRVSSATIDHIFPRSKGGKRYPYNIRPACKFCNGLKADLTMYEFRTKILDLSQKDDDKGRKIYNKYQFSNHRVIFYYEVLAAKKKRARDAIEEGFKRLKEERK